MIPIYDSLFDSGDLWETQITELITSVPSPELVIVLSGKNAMISWPTTATGYSD